MADYDRTEFEPVLVPHFPVAVFTPTSGCPHKGRYRRGSVLCCMACHRSGRDYLPIFKGVVEPPDPIFPDVKNDPFAKVSQLRFETYADKPEPTSYEPVVKLPKETRKERRRRLFGAIVSTLAAGGGRPHESRA